MDMGSSAAMSPRTASTSMAMPTASSSIMASMSMTSAAPASTTSSASDMGGMSGMHDMSGMSHGGDSSCEISMLWNWNTINACFLTPTWHITSRGMFAGSCIGIILLVIALEFLRRLAGEYDAFLRRRYAARQLDTPSSSHHSQTSLHHNQPHNHHGHDHEESTADDKGGHETFAKHPTDGTRLRVLSPDATVNAIMTASAAGTGMMKFRPSIAEQVIRTLLHVLQFAVAYIVMLLAMSYNGYVLFCIFIGASLGFAIFQWRPIPLDGGWKEATLCCG